jgi:hypothetical protein
MNSVFDDLDDICPEELEPLDALTDMYYNEIELTEEEIIVLEEISRQQRKEMQELIEEGVDLPF